MKRLTLLLLALFAAPAFACEDYASWRKVNKDCAWTNAAETATSESSLSSQNPSDITEFCPNYPNLKTDDRNKFWVGLFSAMARLESNYKPSATYVEGDIVDAANMSVVSRGLLQISIESANQERYSCNINTVDDLHDPSINLACGIKIMEYWVKNDNVIATYQKGKNRGGGRYWSVLRKSRGHLPEIMDNTSGLAFCKE